MFRRYPYWGWLLLSIVLGGINAYQFHLHRQAMLPERMTRLVNNDLQSRVAAFSKFTAEPALIQKIYARTLSEKDFARVNELPFYIYCYDHDTLISWNNNSVIATVADSLTGKDVVVSNEKGVFLEKCITPFSDDPYKRTVVLFPIFISYPQENNYLHAHFTASDNIPAKTKITTAAVAGSNPYAVSAAPGGTPAFYLQYNTEEVQKWTPGLLFIIVLIAALIAAFSWVQLMIIDFTRKTSAGKGFAATACSIILLLSVYYYITKHFNLDNLSFFDSKLYASSQYLSSFGDLFINTLCLLWIIVFITRHTPYKTYFQHFREKKYRFLIVVVLLSGLFAYINLFVGKIRDLVLDSSISFDVSHFYTINFYTILGLLVIGGITGISCLVIYLFNLQFQMLIKNKWLKYILIGATGVLLILMKGYYLSAGEASFDWTFYQALLGWLLIFFILLDLRNFTLVSDLFEPHMVFWAIFICGFCTVTVQYFNEGKEREARKAYVKSQLSLQRDYELEFAFDPKAREIENDKALKSFFLKPTAPLRKSIDQLFNTRYISGTPFAKYQSNIYLFNAQGRELFNKDTTSYNELSDLKSESDPTSSPYLFYKEAIHDLHYYVSYIPVYSDTINKVIGYVMIDLDLKKQLSGTVYPELLQSDNKSISPENEYAVGVYINNKLYSQTNEYPFATILKNDTLKKEEPVYYQVNGTSELHYKVNDKRTLVVVHYHSQLLELITLFSYLFVMLVFLAVIILLYQLYLSYYANKVSDRKFLQLTLRRRVHFSMLAVVLVSFIFIGFVTILFFKNQYQKSNADKLQSALQIAKQAVKDDLKKEHAYFPVNAFDTVTRSSRFKSVITGIANGQKIDLNIFNLKGALVNTSEDDIYEKGLISRIMRPDAFYQLNDLGRSILIQDEQVAGLSYLSAYLPLRDDQGVTTGYINVPFFSSEKDLNFQISNIVVSLINLYAFVFLLSSLITVFITRWITKSFQVIIKQFARINLLQNERITWPYDDEIGTLVSEYNKMVNKVEENAARLAQSERESAWREMARQVAHEIKNPLTPMKLNIQFLQQAMRNDNPNIKELTEKVSGSIIEQIDNLSYIASEFSNFAKMPEARPEILELGELLNLAVKLYLNDSQIKVTVSESADKLQVYTDKSQLLRVFMNLLENAKQAIPADREGTIDVCIRAENSNALIIIKDNGAGISAVVAEKIFQPYFTTKSSGTGLGLAMTRKIIEFWKGEIWFETKEDEGTSFFIRLPLNV